MTDALRGADLTVTALTLPLIDLTARPQDVRFT